MLNRVTIMGRLVKDPELRYTQTSTPVCTFTIACERDMKNKDKETVTDFINAVAWRGTADFVAKFFNKGKMIIVDGQLQQRKFTTKDGEKRQVHEVIADNVYFGDSKPGGGHTVESHDNSVTELSGTSEEFPF